ncbi:hypothetical protein ANN_13933 [Periplaneta americana]|uniref:Uncharacterized protein n=1 Tax=Periplaneta americana TaxID=6978 RepID=A0ABQ8SUX3_PERAM|nr:hypothetical protein ANN_13933 [Periplaneta americana]
MDGNVKYDDYNDDDSCDSDDDYSDCDRNIDDNVGDSCDDDDDNDDDGFSDGDDCYSDDDNIDDNYGDSYDSDDRYSYGDDNDGDSCDDDNDYNDGDDNNDSFDSDGYGYVNNYDVETDYDDGCGESEGDNDDDDIGYGDENVEDVDDLIDYNVDDNYGDDDNYGCGDGRDDLDDDCEDGMIMPVLTRWKTWLDAVNYYAEYYGKIMELLEDILFIDSNFKIVFKSIILLESSKLQLSEVLNIVYKVSQTVIQNNNSLISEKVKYYLASESNEGDNIVEMSPGSSTDSYPAFAPIGLRENAGKNLNQLTFPDRDSNLGHLVSRPDALIVTPQVWTSSSNKAKKMKMIDLKLLKIIDEVESNEGEMSQRSTAESCPAILLLKAVEEENLGKTQPGFEHATLLILRPASSVHRQPVIGNYYETMMDGDRTE